MKALNLTYNLTFLDAETDYHKIISFFRISVVALALIDFVSVLYDLDVLLLSNAILPLELGIIESEYYILLNPLYNLLAGYGVTTISFITILSYLYIVVLLFCGSGLYTRLSFFIAILLQLLIFRSMPNFNYGYDHFITMSFFYCLLFPVGRQISLDKYFRRRHTLLKSKNLKNLTLITFLKTHLCIVYFVSGVAKAVDINWWNGNAIWKSMATMDDFIYIPPIILLVISSGTVLLELSYTFLAFTRYRKFLVIHIILMHLGIGIFLGLSSFASIMIIWNLIAFAEDFKKHNEKNNISLAVGE